MSKINRANLWKVRKQIEDRLAAAGATDLTISRNATTVTVESSTGDDVGIPGADATTAGILTAAEFSRLQGIPSGGTTGQVLTKTSGSDYDTEWAAGNSCIINGGKAASIYCDDASTGIAITSISPTSGGTAGGTSVTITGENFDTGAASTTVTFGGSSATSVTVVNDTTITCTTPASSEATVDVVVTQDGESATLTNGFEYIEPVTPFTGIESHSGGNTISTDRRVGWRFTVGGSDLTCNILRLKAETSQDESVKLYKWSDSTLIAEATITADAGNWAEASVTEFVLEAGVDYIVSMRGTNAPSNRTVRANETNTFNSGVTYVESRTATSDVMPNLTTGNTYTACDFGYE